MFLRAVAASGRLAVPHVPVRCAGKAASGKKKLTPKEVKRREMLMLLGRSAMLDMENKPKKEIIPLAHIKANEAMDPYVVPADVEDERVRTLNACAGAERKAFERQRVEMRSALDCRLRALQELDKLSHQLFMFATSMRRRDLPYAIDELADTPPIPGYAPPEISMEGAKKSKI